MKKTIVFVFFLGIVVHNHLQSQNLKLITSSGNYFQNKDLSISWSLGEVVIETINHKSVYFTQGFQQSFKDIPQNAIINNKNDFNISIYPNPANEYITIDYSNNNTHDLQFEIINVTGIVLHNSLLDVNQCSKNINISHLMSGIYFIRIKSISEKHFATFKIQIINH